MQLAPKLTQVVRCITIRGSLCSPVPAYAASPRQAVYLRLFLMLWIAFAAPYSASGAVIHTATFNGHTYYLLDTDGTKWWHEAEAEAALLGGHLVTINTAEEDQWVFETFAPG
jgi:hypothetical protein